MELEKFKTRLIESGFYQDKTQPANHKDATVYFPLTNYACLQVFFYKNGKDFDYLIYHLQAGLHRLPKFNTVIDYDILLYLKFLPTIYGETDRKIREEIDNWNKVFYLGYNFNQFKNAYIHEVSVVYNVVMKLNYSPGIYSSSTLHLTYISNQESINVYCIDSENIHSVEKDIPLNKVKKADSLFDIVKRIKHKDTELYCRKFLIDSFLKDNKDE